MRRRPPSSGKTVPAGRRTGTDTPGRSILSISAPSARRSPAIAAPPSAASRTSGGRSWVTRPSITPALAQKGASGSAAYGSSQAAMPQAMAARSAEVWRRMGNGPRSGRPGIGRRFRHAVRYALLARMKRHALSASQPPTRRAIGPRSAYQRAVSWTPKVCSALAASLSRRVALRPKERSGAVAASGVSRQPMV